MTQGELEKLSLSISLIFSDLELRIMSDVVRRIKINGFSTATSDWEITRMQQLGESEDSIKKWIQAALQASDKEIENIFSDKVYEQYIGYKRVYKAKGFEQVSLEENVQLQQLVEATKRQISGEYQNLAASMGFAIRNSSGAITYSPLLEYYRNTLDNAVIDIHSGSFSYQTVLEKTINQMTSSGVRWIDYNSGHHNRVDVAARRALMSGFRQVQGLINEQVANELGTDSYEVSYHVGARPEHQLWQGRVYKKQELVSVCGLGSVTGLHGANCYHDYTAFVPGISIRTYTDEQLEQMIEAENEPKTYLGKEYTTYEALQQQRKMETTMRKYRQDIKLLQEGKSSANTVMLKKARYQGKMQEYEAFLKAMKLPVQKERIYQNGLGNVSKKIRIGGKEYLVKSYVPGANVAKERRIVNEVIASMPQKVQDALNSGTIINIGKDGASQYDYNHDILYVSKGAEKTEVIHEIGHLVENKLINSQKIKTIRKKIVGEPDIWSIKTDTYYDSTGNPREVILLKNDAFISEYQGRVYSETAFDAFDEDGDFRDELLWEFVSEAFREYIEKPENLKMSNKELYELISEAIE